MNLGIDNRNCWRRLLKSKLKPNKNNVFYLNKKPMTNITFTLIFSRNIQFSTFYNSSQFYPSKWLFELYLSKISTLILAYVCSVSVIFVCPKFISFEKTVFGIWFVQPQ